VEPPPAPIADGSLTNAPVDTSVRPDANAPATDTAAAAGAADRSGAAAIASEPIPSAPPAAERSKATPEPKKPIVTPAKGSVSPPGAPAAKPAPKATAPAKPRPPEAPAQLDPDGSVAGVEAIAEVFGTAPVTTTAPGTIVPIDEADAPPVALQRKLPIYSLQARQMRLAGTVVMNVLVNEYGKVDQVVLVSGVSGADVNDSAMRAATNWTYRPATKEGVPVKVWKSEQIVFKP
jgi:protein TonB